jgi:O-antigen/teichoic acid export membrane protein
MSRKPGMPPILRLDDRAIFVVVNVAVNFFIIIRSYVTMKVLGYSDLGLVALLQTIILLVGVMQFGVLNGAYRLVCSAGEPEARRVNDLVYTFTCALAALLFAGCALATVLSFYSHSYVPIVFFGLLGGILTILKNWTTNYLIAKVMLGSLNLINFVSAFVSIVPLAFVKLNPLLMCLSSLLIQPLAFVAYVLVRNKGLRPTAIFWSGVLLNKIIAAGFVVFLTGMFLAANSQIERWWIISYLGVDGLGRFYLALLFLNLYSLVPWSLDAIFLPRLVQSFVASDHAQMRADLSKFFWLTATYAAAVVACVMLLGRESVEALLPTHIADLEYVYLVMPGVVFLGLTAPFAIVFNVLIQYRYFFYGYGLGTVVTAALLASYAYSTGSIALTAVAVIRSVASVVTGAIVFIGYILVSRAQPAFRFVPFRVSGRSAS